MNKRVFIVHGWGGHPQEGWFPWLKSELEKKGFLVTVPAMPNASVPRIEEWVPALAAAVGKIDANTYFVGHSIGCQAVIRYLVGLPAGSKIGGAVFVAGFFELLNIGSTEAPEIAKPWLESPIDYAKIRTISNKYFGIFSENDKFVPVENIKLFEERIGAKTFLENGGVNFKHFSGSDGVTELPKALELILEMSAAPIISIDDVVKLEIKMGKIISAERVEGSDKLLKFILEFGSDQASEKRTIVSGVAGTYSPEEMLGKQVPVITNLAPRKLKGVESQGMIIYAIDETPNPETGVPMHKAIMLNPQREVPPGSLVQ